MKKMMAVVAMATRAAPRVLPAEDGAKLYAEKTCAACHGYDGRLLNWGNDKEPEFVGTAAVKYPEEVLHKIRNGHPGSIMINLRTMPMRATADVLAYAQTLPVK